MGSPHLQDHAESVGALFFAEWDRRMKAGKPSTWRALAATVAPNFYAATMLKAM